MTLSPMSSWDQVQSRYLWQRHLCASLCVITLGQRSGKGEVSVLERHLLEEVGLESGLTT